MSLQSALFHLILLVAVFVPFAYGYGYKYCTPNLVNAFDVVSSDAAPTLEGSSVKFECSCGSGLPTDFLVIIDKGKAKYCYNTALLNPTGAISGSATSTTEGEDTMYVPTRSYKNLLGDILSSTTGIAEFSTIAAALQDAPTTYKFNCVPEKKDVAIYSSYSACGKIVKSEDYVVKEPEALLKPFLQSLAAHCESRDCLAKLSALLQKSDKIAKFAFTISKKTINYPLLLSQVIAEQAMLMELGEYQCQMILKEAGGVQESCQERCDYYVANFQSKCKKDAGIWEKQTAGSAPSKEDYLNQRLPLFGFKNEKGLVRKVDKHHKN